MVLLHMKVYIPVYMHTIFHVMVGMYIYIYIYVCVCVRFSLHIYMNIAIFVFFSNRYLCVNHNQTVEHNYV